MNKSTKLQEFKEIWSEISKIKNMDERRNRMEYLLRRIRVFFETYYRNSGLMKDIYEASDYPYTIVEEFGFDNIMEKNNNIERIKKSIIVKSLLELNDRISFEEETPMNSLDIISNIFKNFHNVAKQLIYRYNDRPTLEISDEYDIQDLLGALLRVNFDDIRSEEPTPSNAGKSSKIDKLLKIDGIAIETKMTRDNLRDKEIGEEIKIDYVDYKSHPDCKMLVVFIYDSKGLLKNPAGLKYDLEKIASKEFPLKVFISP